MYAIYLRKSRADVDAEKRGEGETLARHKRILTELAKYKDLPVGEIYQEIVSGETIASRPEMQRLLEDVQALKYEGVIVMEVERLARGDTIDQGIVAQTFKGSDTKIVTPSKTYDPQNEFDEEYFEFSLFMSRREYKTIRRRMVAGQAAAAKEGKYISSIPPYGYKRFLSSAGWTLEPDPEEAPYLQSIFDWYVNGVVQPDGKVMRLGVSRIARRLNDMHVPTRRGGSWTPATIRDMLINQVYIGRVSWTRNSAARKHADRQSKREYHEGLHPALVDKEVFEKACSIIAEKRLSCTHVSKELVNPLAGVVRCGICGRSMKRRPTNFGPVTIMCTDAQCPNTSALFNLVEDKLVQSIMEWIDGYSVVQKAPERPQEASAGKLVKSIGKEIDDLVARREKAYDLLERGVYSDEEFFTRRGALSKKIEEATLRLEEQKRELEEKSLRDKMLKETLPKWKTAMEAYPHLTPQEKNDVLKTILVKAVYRRDKSSRWKTDQYDAFELDLYPRWPKT